jgi:ATP-dependent Lhr-like helicase
MISDLQLLKKLGTIGHAFYGGFQGLREIQRQALIPILEGNNVLLASATASGKTEAVFAPLIVRLVKQRNLLPHGIRILAVEPTRALVNDLYKRLEIPLSQISWTCGRQTADCSDKNKRPHVLITTPESFDSMLVRGGKWERGVLVDHLLASVRAVFLDEAHLYISSPRGDQIVWLLARLRRLLDFAFGEALRPFPGLQICAASATISHPQEIAIKLLGERATVVQVAGSRELELLSPIPEKRWQKIASFDSIQEIYHHIARVDGTNNLDALSNHIWNAIERGEEEFCRKVLIFVPTRTLCDRLSSFLADKLGKRRRMFIAGHHASLEKDKREHAEQEFARRRDAILVATTTLEVGIDIGDVDVVALVGPPPDTSSFLQRVGRAGRRSDCVRIVAVARNELEARAFASLIHAASKGELEQVDQGRRWSVFVQQTASFVAQSGNKGRRHSDLFQLVSDVWPEPDIARSILDHLIEEEIIVEQAGRLFLGEEFANKLEEGRGSFHHNFESDATGLPVIDACTGEVIARVSDLPSSQGSVALAGQNWEYSLVAGEVILKASSAKKNGNIVLLCC